MCVDIEKDRERERQRQRDGERVCRDIEKECVFVRTEKERESVCMCGLRDRKRVCIEKKR